MAEPRDASPALRDVQQRYGDWIERRVRSLVRADWEDVMQDVYLRLAHALPRMRDHQERALRSLIGRTVRSVCIDTFRRRSYRGTLESAAAEETPDPSQGAIEKAERADELARLDATWKHLAEREREILVLRFRDGLTFRQIGEVLSVPQGSVAGWYSRALARMRELLA